MLIQEYPTSMVCDVVGCARSSYYHRLGERPDEKILKADIKAVAAQWPTYGYRRMTAQLNRDEKWHVNHKRVQRLMQLMGIQAKIKRRNCRTTNSAHSFPRYPNLVQDLEVVCPEHVWVSDITYIGLRFGFAYLAVIMDVFTRGIRGWHLSRDLDHSLTLRALERAMVKHPAPQIHHSDQGVQYAATAYTQTLRDVNVRISMADLGQAWQNGYAERLIRTIKEEEVALSEYIDYGDARRQLGRFLDDVYLHKRIHSSLGYLTPAEFEAQWREEQALAIELN